MRVTHSAVILISTGAWLGAGVEGHIGEPCNSVFRICLPPSPNIYCDEGNICRCKSDFPVEIQPHVCKSAKRIGQRCTHLRECTHTDPNSFCTKAPYASECSCSQGHTYSYSEERCVPVTSPKGGSGRSDSKWFLSSTIGFTLICLGIAFCLSFFYYFFCRTTIPPDSWEQQMRHREARTQIVRLNDRAAGEYFNVRTSSGSSHLPTYDSAVYNQPPPSYEDAVKIKDYSDTFVPSSSSSHCPPTTTTAEPVSSVTATTVFISPET